MAAADSGPDELEGSWDVIVVGHGAAGLSAALSFLETVPKGSAPRVAVLDRADRQHRGGSTAWTTSIFRLDGDAQLDPEWREIVRHTAGHHADDEYIEAFYENATDTLNWIRNHGVEIGSAPAPFPLSFGKRTWFPRGGGRAIVDVLGAAIEERGASVFYSVTAVRLATDASSRVSGLVVRSLDGAVHFMQAPAVILASGGFEANPEMLTRYIPNAYKLKTVSPGTDVNTGDGIRMAVEIGADTAGQFDGAHLEPVDPRSSNREAVVGLWMFGILVNQQGERFMDEAERSFDIQFDQVGNRLFREQGGRGYAIADAGIRARVPGFEALIDHENPPLRADTIEGIADLLGIPGDSLRHTIEQYNGATKDDEFDPARFDGKSTVGITPRKSNWAEPLLTPPYEAVPVEANICFTYGGLRVDARSRVLNADRQPIPGLWAAGEVTGIFYQLYPSGTSVLRSLTFGRIAGREVASAHP
jgi:tricarballylate dehydrogenase